MSRDEGMTLLEVMLAISILLIGVGFIVKSDSVMYHYRNQREVRQQMLFYAAGQLERVLQNPGLIQEYGDAGSSFEDFYCKLTKNEKAKTTDGVVIPYLELIEITVEVTGRAEPVTLSTYRVSNE